ncbi:MAG TPA: MYXO-CTERM sorting domain-containing protein [Polyangia bacterium]|nr:MYXO-CTERM sorting domain-containing protein [Polyangia bacterium]
MRAWLMVCVVVVFAPVGAGVARADVAPPDACTSPGQPCQTAGARYDQGGICMTTVCTKYMPSADGGGTTMRYDCNRCQVSDAGVTTGTGGATATGGSQGAGGSTGTGGAGIPPNCCGVPGGTGCAVAPRDGDRAGLGGLGLLAAVGLTVFLRRRARSTKHAAD